MLRRWNVIPAAGDRADMPGIRKHEARSPQKPAMPHLLQSREQFLYEKQQADAIIQPLLDTENGFIKDLELYLAHSDTLALRKRELLHRHWTECVWRPIQRGVERRFTHHLQQGVEPMRTMLANYIAYCNAKGFVFLEDYDPGEYEPFLLQLSRPHCFKVSTPPLKDPLFFQSHARMREKRDILRCQTGYVCEGLPKKTAKRDGRDKGSWHRGSRSGGTVYLATAEGRCFQPECWSCIGVS